MPRSSALSGVLCGNTDFVRLWRKKVLDKRTPMVYNRHIIQQTIEAEVKLHSASTESSGG